MTADRDLFGWEPDPRYPERAGFTEPTTSREAAEKIEPLAKTLRRQVLLAYEHAHPAGMTADEVAARLGRSILSIRPRVTELEKQGLILKTSVRRLNESGMRAVVLKINKETT